VGFQALGACRLFQPSIQSFRERSVFIAGLFNCTTATPILAFELFVQANAGLAAGFSNRRTPNRLFSI
jgi:hypothetical protein